MRGLLLGTVLLISGCDTSSDDYLKIIQLCKERQGTYFTVMIPSIVGPRLAAGCLEDKK